MRTAIKTAEWVLRHRLVYPVLRLVFRNKRLDGPVDLKNVRKVLILRYDRIGDIIVTTPLFRKLKECKPGLILGVLASTANAEIIRTDPNVDRIYVLHRSVWRLVQEIVRARRERYDVVLNFIFNRTTSGGILANLIAPRGIKIGQGAEKYRFYFNRLLTLDRGSKHMVEVLAGYVTSVFGLKFKRGDLRFALTVDPSSKGRVESFLARKGLHSGSAGGRGYAVLNLSATDPVRKISTEQSVGIVRFLASERGIPVILTSAPHEAHLRSLVRERAGGFNIESYPEAGTANLSEIAQLVGNALLVITPDTSIVHFASAMGTPLFGLYTHAQIPEEWMPFGVPHSVVFSPENQPASAIAIPLIEKELARFLSSITVKKKRSTKR